MKKVISFLMAMVLCVSLFAGCGKKEPKTYIVEFDLKGGEKISGKLKQTVEKGESAKAPKVEKEGYFFDEWDTDFDEVTEDLVVKARWKKAITITWDPGEGKIDSGEKTVTVPKGSAVTAPSVSCQDMEFTGWSPEIEVAEEDVTYVAQWKKIVLSAERIYEKLASSVVEIHTYDANGRGIALGSGFFIDDKGTVLTNHHVIEGAYQAEIVMADENVYAVVNVLGYDENIDMAILETRASNTTPVKISDEKPKTGEKIYTLGSSKGLTGTFSDGLVSTASRVDGGVEYIQISAPISSGNSGGPLVNEYGEVLGVNTWQYVEGQNLNFAVSIREKDKLDLSNPMTMFAFGDISTPEKGTDYTMVLTGDEGEEVYEIAGAIEWEDNDEPANADFLQEGTWMAGYVDETDFDFYEIDIYQPTVLEIHLMSYWYDDEDYFLAALCDENTDIFDEKTIGRNSYISSLDRNDEEECFIAYFDIQKAGTYYLAVFTTEEYPYDVGIYYLAGYVLN